VVGVVGRWATGGPRATGRSEGDAEAINNDDSESDSETRTRGT
jgi:hypothetical protein